MKIPETLVPVNQAYTVFLLPHKYGNYLFVQSIREVEEKTILIVS
jgi:hypothetical protein